MVVRDRLNVVLLGLLTVTAVVMAGIPAQAAPGPSAESGATESEVLEPGVLDGLREGLARLRPLPADRTAELVDRLARDVRSGTVPVHTVDDAVWEQAAAFELPDGQILVAAAQAGPVGDSVGALYASNGVLAHHLDTHSVTRSGGAVETTAWIDGRDPVHETFDDSRLRAVALDPVAGVSCAYALTWSIGFPILAVVFTLVSVIPLFWVFGSPIIAGVMAASAVAMWLAVPFACTIGLLL
ncbi:hypothetical protein [Nocardia brasiliensis]|uniref:hypothetical protein n=1 Tax=Nocardia brasiliensis TaxID=37326 RepID=UPI001895F777|nr:hypothetical protein [Nocardia brasiliensis]MBF6543185.1 hypothetical protein [Nocardia brasiliensis]